MGSSANLERGWGWLRDFDIIFRDFDIDFKWEELIQIV